MCVVQTGKLSLRAPRMPLWPKLAIQKRQLRQLARLDLVLMLHHLLNIPVRAHEASLQEVCSRGIEPERQSPGESLRVFGEGREGVNDHASVVGGDDTGVDGEGSEGWILCDITKKGEELGQFQCDKRDKWRSSGRRETKRGGNENGSLTEIQRFCQFQHGEFAGRVGADARHAHGNGHANEVDDGACAAKALDEGLVGDEGAFDVGFL